MSAARNRERTVDGSTATEPSPATARRPRVALVHDWLTGMRGGEKVLEAVAELFPRAPIYTLFHFRGSVSESLERHPIRTSWLQSAPGLRRHYRRYLPLFPAAIEDHDLGDFELIVSTSHCVAKGVVPPPGAVHVCYCHTPMRYAWDQEHAYFPRRRGVVARIRGQLLSALRTWDAASASRVDHFVANSRFVARRIRRYYGRDAEVIAPPVDVDSFSVTEAAGDNASKEETAGGEGDRFALSVAALAPYKRHDVAIEACRRLGLRLKIVGDGPERRRLERLAGDGARLLGRIDDEELRRLYRRASVFVQPGIEDFGIAAVEALASGTPIAAAGEGGILDIVVDGENGVLYPPEAGDTGLADAIDKAIRLRSNPLDLRERADHFSVAHFQERFRNCLRSQAGDLVSGLPGFP